MKVVSLRCIRLHGILDEPIGIGEERWLNATETSLNPFRDWRSDGRRNLRATFLEIETDNGLLGHSRPIGPDHGRAICRDLAQRLVGRDPEDVEVIWKELHPIVTAHADLKTVALMAVDMALWDLRGKASGLPVYRLLNPGGRKSLPVYASTVGCSVASRRARERAAALRDAGFRAQKWFFKFGPDADGNGRAGNLRLVRDLRETLGEGYPLMFDATFGWGADYAIEMARAMAGFDPCWLEDPVAAGSWDTLNRIRRETGVRIAAGDHVQDTDSLRRILDVEAVDIFQPDEGALGGITPMMRAAAICREYGVPFVPHCGDMATLQVLAAQDETLCPWFEYLVLWFQVGQWFYRTRCLPGAGMLAIPDEPGLGIEFDPGRVTRVEEIL